MPTPRSGRSSSATAGAMHRFNYKRHTSATDNAVPAGPNLSLVPRDPVDKGNNVKVALAVSVPSHNSARDPERRSPAAAAGWVADGRL